MRNLVINCNVSVKDSFDEEKVKDAFMRLFIVTVNSDIKINGFRINDIDDSVLDQIPPLSKEHLGWEAPDRSEILAMDKDYVLMRQYTNPDGSTYDSWSPKDVFEKSYQIAQDFKDRLAIELKELEERLVKLTVFIDSHGFGKIAELCGPDQAALMLSQYHGMSLYHNALKYRIELLNAVSNEEPENNK